MHIYKYCVAFWMFNCKVFGRTKNTPLNVQNTAVERLVFKLEATGSFYTNMHHQHNWVLSNSPHSGWLKARTNLCLEHIDPWNKINIKPNVCRIVMKHPCQFFFMRQAKTPAKIILLAFIGTGPQDLNAFSRICHQCSLLI